MAKRIIAHYSLLLGITLLLCMVFQGPELGPEVGLLLPLLVGFSVLHYQLKERQKSTEQAGSLRQRNRVKCLLWLSTPFVFTMQLFAIINIFYNRASHWQEGMLMALLLIWVLSFPVAFFMAGKYTTWQWLHGVFSVLFFATLLIAIWLVFIIISSLRGENLFIPDHF